jgi:hypothetical protein
VGQGVIGGKGNLGDRKEEREWNWEISERVQIKGEKEKEKSG